MSIDIETARRVAKLARIKVEEEDLPALAGEFNAILGFIEQLNEVDVDGDGLVDCDDPDGDGYGVGADCLGADCREGDPSCHEAGSCRL